MFGRYSDAPGEMKAPIINEISKTIYEKLQEQDEWHGESYEEEKEIFFKYIAEKENEKTTMLEKEMLFITNLIRGLIDHMHHVKI